MNNAGAGRSMWPWRIPLRMRFRELDIREGVLLHGRAGWGEFSPFPDYRPRHAARWLRAAEEAADEGWPAPVRTRVAVNAIVPAVAPGLAHDIVTASGCSTAKVKIGLSGDEARVEAVRDALGPGGKLRVDANGSWGVDTAARRIHALQRFDLEYVEQPVSSLDDMADLRRRVDVPLAVDESLRTAADPMALDLRRAADVAVLKVAPLGGVAAALRIAEACGLPVVVSSALESSIGLAAGLALAAALPELPYACGLGTAALLARDLTDDPLVPRDGALTVRRPEPSEALLDAARVEPSDDFVPLELLRRARAAAG